MDRAWWPRPGPSARRVSGTGRPRPPRAGAPCGSGSAPAPSVWPSKRAIHGRGDRGDVATDPGGPGARRASPCREVDPGESQEDRPGRCQEIGGAGPRRPVTSRRASGGGPRAGAAGVGECSKAAAGQARGADPGGPPGRRSRRASLAREVLRQRRVGGEPGAPAGQRAAKAHPPELQDGRGCPAGGCGSRCARRGG